MSWTLYVQILGLVFLGWLIVLTTLAQLVQYRRRGPR